MADVAQLNVSVASTGVEAARRAVQGLGASFTKTQASIIAVNQAMELGTRLVRGSQRAFEGLLGPALDFQLGIIGVSKTVNATPAAFSKLTDELKNLDKILPIATTELLGIGEAAGQLDIKTQNIEKFTETMVRLGVSTNLGTIEAGKALARFINITGLPQEEIDRLGSTIVQLGNNLATTEQEIVTMGLRIAAAGKQARLADADILGLSGTLSSLGVRAELGGTAASRVLLEIAQAANDKSANLERFAQIVFPQATDAASKFLEQLEGGQSGELLVGFARGLDNLAQSGETVRDVLGSIGVSNFRSIDVFGRLSQNPELLAKSIELANVEFRLNQELLKESNKFFGATRLKITALGKEINAVVREAGLKFLPTLDAFLDKTIEWVDVNQELFAQDLAVFIRDTGQAALAAARSIGLLVGAMNALPSAELKLGVTLAGLGGAIGGVPGAVAGGSYAAAISILNRGLAESKNISQRADAGGAQSEVSTFQKLQGVISETGATVTKFTVGPLVALVNEMAVTLPAAFLEGDLAAVEFKDSISLTKEELRALAVETKTAAEEFDSLASAEAAIDWAGRLGRALAAVGMSLFTQDLREAKALFDALGTIDPLPRGFAQTPESGVRFPPTRESSDIANEFSLGAALRRNDPVGPPLPEGVGSVLRIETLKEQRDRLLGELATYNVELGKFRESILEAMVTPRERFEDDLSTAERAFAKRPGEFKEVKAFLLKRFEDEEGITAAREQANAELEAEYQAQVDDIGQIITANRTRLEQYDFEVNRIEELGKVRDKVTGEALLSEKEVSKAVMRSRDAYEEQAKALALSIDPAARLNDRIENLLENVREFPNVFRDAPVAEAIHDWTEAYEKGTDKMMSDTELLKESVNGFAKDIAGSFTDLITDAEFKFEEFVQNVGKSLIQRELTNRVIQPSLTRFDKFIDGLVKPEGITIAGFGETKVSQEQIDTVNNSIANLGDGYEKVVQDMEKGTTGFLGTIQNGAEGFVGWIQQLFSGGGGQSFGEALLSNLIPALIGAGASQIGNSNGLGGLNDATSGLTDQGNGTYLDDFDTKFTTSRATSVGNSTSPGGGPPPVVIQSSLQFVTPNPKSAGDFARAGYPDFERQLIGSVQSGGKLAKAIKAAVQP